MPSFQGFDHIDCRVRSLAAVESFYDEILPVLGLTEKRYFSVDAHGEWHDIADTYNVVEYGEPPETLPSPHFIGFIEDPLHRHNETRIAFRVTRDALAALLELLRKTGAQNVEESDEPGYAAIFFEDPSGTKLEFLGS